MKTSKEWGRKYLAIRSIRLLTVVAVIVFFSQQVMASTAANTAITNTVTVTYDDAAGVAQTPETASTTVTVTLVAAAPTLNSPGGIDPSSENTLNSLTYIISSNANGPDTYDLASVSVDDANLSAPTLVNNAPTNPIALGGTTLAVATLAADTVITVPYDGVNDGVVNGIGIQSPSFIIIGGSVAQVNSITENPGANTATITLTGAIGVAAPAGTVVGEQITFTLDVTTGALSSGSNGTHTITMTATSVADNSLSTSQATPTVITVRRPQLTVGKFVRNVDVPAMTGNPPTASDGTFTYYASGITGEPGEELAYLIVVTNPANSGTATDVIIQDPIPMYTNYVAGSMQLDPGTGAFAGVSDSESDNDAGEYDPTSGSEAVWIYAGTGGDCGNVANTSGDGTGGTLAGPVAVDVVTRGIFHVTIQP